MTLRPVPHTRNAVSGHSGEGKTTPNSPPDVVSVPEPLGTITWGYACLQRHDSEHRCYPTKKIPLVPVIGWSMAQVQPPRWMCIRISGGHNGHRATGTFWHRQHLAFVFALASAKLLLKYFQGDVLSQQLGMEMPLLRGEYHQKHLVPGRCSTGQVQSQASPAGKERREVKDKLKLERKLNMLFCRTLLALICQFFSTLPFPLPVVQCKHLPQLVRARGLGQPKLLGKATSSQGFFLATSTTAGPLCTHHHILNLVSTLLLPIHGSAACRTFLC